MARFGLAEAFGRLRTQRSGTGAPERLRDSLIRLGVTFVKFGQSLSVRRDLLPDEYTAALQTLQDRVPPFPTAEAFREIERGLARPISEVFAEIDPVPIAAGSIAQVHAARLNDGQQVIVKVQRTGIRPQLERDMRALRLAVRFAQGLVPRLHHYQPLRVIDEIWMNLRKETDFREEAKNIRRFAAAFADSPTIAIPGVIGDLVSEAVIVQERSDGVRIDDPSLAPDGPRLARVFVEAYLQQIFVMGAFHGDPHPGNLFIMPDGRICFHDFGLIGILDRPTRRKLAAFTVAFIQQDADWLLDTAIDLGVLGGTMDRAVFRRGLAEIIADFSARPFKEWSLADAFLRVARLGRAENVLVPYDLVVLMRSMALAENTVRVLDPQFELVETLRVKGPEALKAAMEGVDPKQMLDRIKVDAAAAISDLPVVLGRWVRQLGEEGRGPGLNLELRGLESLEEHIDRSSNRVALALVTLGLYIAGSLLSQHSIGPRILGDFPAFAAAAYALALWFTFRLARGIRRSGKL
jgi:ubiquinone biosynthesis protein